MTAAGSDRLFTPAFITLTASMTPALFAATFAQVAPAERGMASGTATIFIDLGFSGGPFVAAAQGFPAAFAVSAAIALAGATGTVIGLRSRRSSVPA